VINLDDFIEFNSLNSNYSSIYGVFADN